MPALVGISEVTQNQIVPLLSVVDLPATTCAVLLFQDRQIRGFGGGSGDPAGAEWDSNTKGETT